MQKRNHNDPISQYPKNIREKLANSRIIQDAIRNCKARGVPMEETMQRIGAGYEITRRIYDENKPHDTNKRHTEDD